MSAFEQGLLAHFLVVKEVKLRLAFSLAEHANGYFLYVHGGNV